VGSVIGTSLLVLIFSDVKPRNALIMIGSGGTDRVVLSDLGLSQYCERIWRNGVGTGEYFPPEIARRGLDRYRKEQFTPIDYQLVDSYALGL
jgi:serine/threonine protein kinase